MLILSRLPGEKIFVGDDIEFVVLHIDGNKVRIGITAPREIVVDREEVAERKRREEENQVAQETREK